MGAQIPQRGSLIVVGTGINGVGQTTLEAIACMELAEKLFYIVNDPTTAFWIQQRNPTATSLADLYKAGKPRRDTYADMTERLVSAVRSGAHVCAAFYGHPGVLVEASHRAIRILRREGYPARMLPGISTDGCLVADLGVNPGDRGLQSFEATDFLLSRRRFDPTSDLILWQVGVLGEFRTGRDSTGRPQRIRTLTTALCRRYPRRHRVVLYEAATFAMSQPVVRRVTLEKLPRTRILPLTTLYVPALPQRPIDPKILQWYQE